MSQVDVREIRDSVGDRHLDSETVHEADQFLALAELVPREGDRPARELHLEPVQQVGLHVLLRREVVAGAAVGGIHDRALDELRPCFAACGTAFRVEVARVQKVVDPHHRGTEHMPRVLEHDAEAVEIDLLPVRERLPRPPATHFEDLQGLWRHDAARRQVVHVSVAHDTPRRFAHGVQGHLFEKILDKDPAFVADPHQERLVNTYRVGTRRLSPVQYLHRSHRYPSVTVPPKTVMFRTFLRRYPQTGHLTSDLISAVSRVWISKSTSPDSIASTRSLGSPTRYLSSPFRSFSTSALSRRWLSTTGRVLKTRTRESRTRVSFGIRCDGIGRGNVPAPTKASGVVTVPSCDPRHGGQPRDPKPRDGSSCLSAWNFNFHEGRISRLGVRGIVVAMELVDLVEDDGIFLFGLHLHDHGRHAQPHRRIRDEPDRRRDEDREDRAGEDASQADGSERAP